MQNHFLKITILGLALLFLLEGAPVANAGTPEVPGMILIKADCFVMGSEDFVVEEPEHKVCLNEFFLGVYEVTQKQFEKVMGYNPSRFKGVDKPVENVSWHDAIAFIERINQMNPGLNLDLYAARAGSVEPYFWGLVNRDDFAWHQGNSKKETHPVGKKKANPLGC